MKAESRELRRANEILKAASAFPGWSRAASGVSLRFLRGQSTSVGSRANLHCLVPVRHAPVAWVHGATNAMSNAKLNLCPLVQHKPPTPRPGCHRTPTSRKPTCNNAKEGGLNVPTRDPGLGRPIKRLHHAGTAPVAGCYTLYGALHPIRTGAMPTDRVQCPRIWCTALADKNDRGTWNPTTRKKAA